MSKLRQDRVIAAILWLMGVGACIALISDAFSR
jgi:hypothetical protein